MQFKFGEFWNDHENKRVIRVVHVDDNKVAIVTKPGGLVYNSIEYMERCMIKCSNQTEWPEYEPLVSVRYYRHKYKEAFKSDFDYLIREGDTCRTNTSSLKSPWSRYHDIAVENGDWIEITEAEALAGPKYVPWTFETCPTIEKLRNKKTKDGCTFHSIDNDECWLSACGRVPYCVAFEEYERIYGTPCGTVVQP